MRIVTTRELRSQTKAIFELAREDRIAVKRGKEYVTLTVSDDPTKPLLNEEWVRAFFAIPEEFRVNPFDVSPYGDVVWADLRNIEDDKLRMKLGSYVKYQSWREVRRKLGLLKSIKWIFLRKLVKMFTNSSTVND